MAKRSCPVNGNISFPLKTNIKNLESFYNSIKNKPNIYADFLLRYSIPKYLNNDRSNGEINESSTSMIVTYNNIKYNVVSVQICLPTHTNWLINYTNTAILNKIDFIVTLENTNENPRFVIMVVPLIIDNSLTTDNIYLTNLAEITNTIPSSLENIFNGLNNFFYYKTCLEPNGDNAFVYVNLNGIKISEMLYYNLLALYTNTDIEVIQQYVKDNILPPFKSTLNKHIHSTLEIPIINNNFENWPRYTPPYDIILNVNSRNMNFNIESFQDVGDSSSDTMGTTDTGLGPSPVPSPEPSPVAALESRPSPVLTTSPLAISSMKCVPLDLDNVVDSNGNISFDADGNVLLSDVKAQREALRQSAQVNKVSLKNLQTYFAPTIAILLVLFIILYVIIPNIPVVNNAYLLGKGLLPDYTSEIGFYGLIAMIFAFSGFLIGAAITSS